MNQAAGARDAAASRVPELPAEFTVSVNTVKSHIRSIYAKLGVSTRREAVLHAQDRGLVP